MEEDRDESMEESAEDNASRSSSEGGDGDLDNSVRGEIGDDNKGESMASRRGTGVKSMADRFAAEGATSRAGVWVVEGKRVREGTREFRKALVMDDRADLAQEMGEEKTERELVVVGCGGEVGSVDWERVRLSEPRQWEEESQVVNFPHPCPLCSWPTRLFTPIASGCLRAQFLKFWPLRPVCNI
jgi:hypothetical protein